jgi:hypothetical protein
MKGTFERCHQIESLDDRVGRSSTETGSRRVAWKGQDTGQVAGQVEGQVTLDAPTQSVTQWTDPVGTRSKRDRDLPVDILGACVLLPLNPGVAAP